MMNLKWRILDANDNILILISDTTANTGFTLQGADGYNNGVLLLNNACKAMYSNDLLGANGRSLDIDDIEKYMTYNKYSYSGYGNEYTPSERNYPNIFEKELNGAPNGTYGTELDLSEQDDYITGYTSASTLKGKWTYYTFTMSTTTMKNQTYVELFNSSKETFLASRCVQLYSDSAVFNIFRLIDNTIDGAGLFYSGRTITYGSCAIRPIVEIDLTKVNVGLTGDGGATTPYSIEAK